MTASKEANYLFLGEILVFLGGLSFEKAKKVPNKCQMLSRHRYEYYKDRTSYFMCPLRFTKNPTLPICNNS